MLRSRRLFKFPRWRNPPPSGARRASIDGTSFPASPSVSPARSSLPACRTSATGSGWAGMLPCRLPSWRPLIRCQRRAESPAPALTPSPCSRQLMWHGDHPPGRTPPHGPGSCPAPRRRPSCALSRRRVRCWHRPHRPYPRGRRTEPRLAEGQPGRTIDLSTRAVAELRACAVDRKAEKVRRKWSELPFFCSTTGTYPDPGNIRDAFARVVKAAKLPDVTPHGLRHTYASLLLQAGTDVYYVSRMLGHASISETADRYGRWLPANRKGALDVLDAPAVPLVQAEI